MNIIRTPINPIRAALAALALAAGLAALAPATSDAATASRCQAGRWICFQAAPGETNNVYTTRNSTWRVYDVGAGATLRPGSGCREVRRNVIDCGSGTVSRVRIALGDRNDVYQRSDPSGAFFVVYGQEGNDRIQPNEGFVQDYYWGGTGRDHIDYYKETRSGVSVTLDGIPNDGKRVSNPEFAESDQVMDFEDITGSQRADYLRGDTGTNVLRGHAGADIVDGNHGADYLDEGSELPDAPRPRFPRFPRGDLLIGGPGTDLVDYRYRTEAVTVTIGDGAHNDGRAREGDFVAGDIERVTGGAGNDTLLGTNAAEVFNGLGGNDRIDPRGGQDFVNGDAGDDVIELRDGARDTFSTRPGNDAFFADPIDVRVE